MKEIMATANQDNPPANQGNPSSSASRIAIPFRRYLAGRRGLILLAVAVLAAGAFLKWDWLVAAGIAPLLLAFAPCAAMCALGLCMNKMGGKSCSSESKANDQKAEAAPPIENADVKPSSTALSDKAHETT